MLAEPSWPSLRPWSSLSDRRFILCGELVHLKGATIPAYPYVISTISSIVLDIPLVCQLCICMFQVQAISLPPRAVPPPHTAWASISRPSTLCLPRLAYHSGTPLKVILAPAVEVVSTRRGISSFHTLFRLRQILPKDLVTTVRARSTRGCPCEAPSSTRRLATLSILAWLLDLLLYSAGLCNFILYVLPIAFCIATDRRAGLLFSIILYPTPAGRLASRT